jgi:putative transposase
MRESQFREAQIVVVLREGEAGVPIAETLRKYGISRPTFHLWKQKYGSAGMHPDNADRGARVDGNSRVPARRMLADRVVPPRPGPCCPRHAVARCHRRGGQRGRAVGLLEVL